MNSHTILFYNGKKTELQSDEPANYVLKTFRINFIDVMLAYGKTIYRDFPWRRERSPYKVFISEIFLQRTRADQVLPVYLSFINKYPTFKQLISDFDVTNVKNILKPLGLIKRVEIIRDVISSFRSNESPKIPDQYKKLTCFKGIGEYIALATLCFGFNKKKAILDTNIARIYRRLFNIRPKTKSPKNDTFLWDFCQKMLPEELFVEFNYYLLDFGGLICLSRNPKCLECPFNKDCFYFHENRLNKG